MKNFKHLLVMFLGIVLVACNDDPDEVVDPIITVTPPATYAFERDGARVLTCSYEKKGRSLGWCRGYQCQYYYNLYLFDQCYQ